VTGAAVATSVARLARAKLNLTLRITGRREDGYHLLDSLVAFAEIGDRLTARLADRGSFTVSGPFASALADESDNLVTRAASALAVAAGVPADLAARTVLALEKNLPVASGIGGGSADAAATLHALMALWQVELSGAARARLALSLGADVPVCLAGEAARMRGIGDSLEPLPALPPAYLVLVNPCVPCPTGPVFKARPGAFSEPLGTLESPRDAAGLAALVCRGGNDLEPPAITICPPIGIVLARLRQEATCLAAAMSGSGGTCFGLFAQESEAADGAHRIAAEQADWWVAATRLARSDQAAPPS
jgi:4-diphosphocytidyl-2-C-methyl-D-erythritol kinase